MIWTLQDVESLRARAETIEQRAGTLHVSLGAARMDVRNLIESREADRLKKARGYASSRAHTSTFCGWLDGICEAPWSIDG
ncbi:hypothetical protein Tco_0053034 [Tanacetum coccineum]